MENRRTPITLTTILGMGLLAYHVHNLFHLSALSPGYKWKPSRLAVTAGGRDWLSAPTVTGLRNRRAVTDASARRLGELGGMARYFAGQAQMYVHVGVRDPLQWMYVREEAFVQYPRGADWVRRSYTDPVLPWVRRLERQGVTTVVLAVPTKMSIERDGAGPGPLSWDWMEPPPAVEDPYGNYGAFVGSLPRHAVDLYRRFLDHRASDPKAVFYRPLGTHWTTLGASLAAAAVVDKLRERGWKLPSPRIDRLDAPEPAHDDSFPDLLLLPDYLTGLSPRWRWSQPSYRLAAPVAAPGNGRLVVVGSSYAYSNPEGYRYGEQLARALGRELHSYASPGDTHHETTLGKMKADGFFLRPSDLVVLEFPFRFPWPEGKRLPDPAVASDRQLGSPAHPR